MRGWNNLSADFAAPSEKPLAMQTSRTGLQSRTVRQHVRAGAGEGLAAPFLERSVVLLRGQIHLVEFL